MVSQNKILLDEQLYHRLYTSLNEHFDVKDMRDDLHLSGLPDPKVYERLDAEAEERRRVTALLTDQRPVTRATEVVAVELRLQERTGLPRLPD